MALIVEDGSGKSDAEAYVSVADADTYHANRSGNSTWAAAADDVKERALRLATQWLDTTYKELWAGVRWSDSQLLDWPRICVTVDSLARSSDEIPTQLTEASAELAFKIVVDGDTLFNDVAKDGDVHSTSVRVGPITKSVTYLGGSVGVKSYRLIEALIKPLLDISNQLERA